jgi:hypothetical protein
MNYRKFTIAVLVGINIAAHFGGSVIVRGEDNPQDSIDKLNIEALDDNYDESLDIDIMRGAGDTTVVNHANNEFGFDKDDLEKVDKGYYLMPDSVDPNEDLSHLDALSEQSKIGSELELERERTKQALNTTLEARAMQQYLDEFHKALEESYDEAKERSEHLDTEIKHLERYLNKFTAIVTQCT